MRKVKVRYDGKVWPSVTALARHIGCATSQISRSLRLGYQVRGKRVERLDGSTPAYPGSRGDLMRAKKSRAVTRLEDGAEWPSATKAACSLGVPRQTILAAIEHGGRYRGYHYVWSDGRAPKHPQMACRVGCIVSGMRYESMAAAGRAIGLTRERVRQLVREGQNACVAI